MDDRIFIVESGNGIEYGKMKFNTDKEFRKVMKEKHTYNDKDFIETLIIDEILEEEDNAGN